MLYKCYENMKNVQMNCGNWVSDVLNELYIWGLGHFREQRTCSLRCETFSLFVELRLTDAFI